MMTNFSPLVALLATLPMLAAPKKKEAKTESAVTLYASGGRVVKCAGTIIYLNKKKDKGYTLTV